MEQAQTGDLFDEFDRRGWATFGAFVFFVTANTALSLDALAFELTD